MNLVGHIKIRFIEQFLDNILKNKTIVATLDTCSLLSALISLFLEYASLCIVSTI